MPDNSFIEKLRMANIFPANGGPRTDVPFGMPDFYSGRPMMEPQQEVVNPRIMQQQDMGPIPNTRPQPFQNAPNTEPPNVIYKPSGLDDIGARILGPTLAEREVLGMKNEVGKMKVGVSQQDANTRLRKQELAEKIADGKATDAEKQEYKLAQITLQGDIHSRQIGERGDETMEQIHARGDESRDTAKLTGEQRLGEISARGGEQRKTNEAKPGKEELPTQTKTRQANSARELMNTRPDLAKFIKLNPDGSFGITPTGDTDFWGNATGPNKQQFDEINSKIFGTAPTAPKSTPKPVSKPKDSLGIR